MATTPDLLRAHAPLGRAGLGLVDGSAELFVELQSAREALTAGRLSRANRLAGKVLVALTTMRERDGRPISLRQANPELIRAAATCIRGRVALRQFRHDEAQGMLGEAVSIWSGLQDAGMELDQAARSELLEALLLAGRGPEALAGLRRMVDAGSDLPTDAVLRVAKWFEGQNPTGAIDLLRQVRERRPDEPLFAATMAAMLERAGRPAEASLAHIDAAVLLAGEEDLSAAEEHFKAALADDPELMTARFGLVRVHLLQDRPQDALEVLEGAETASRSVEHLTLQVYALWAAGRVDDAHRAVLGALADHQDDPALARAKIQLDLARGEYRSAADDLRRLLADDQDDPGLRLLKARALIGLGEAAEPLAILHELAGEFPDIATIPALSAQAAAMLGRHDEALGAMLQAQSADPTDPDVRQVRGWLVDRWTDFAAEHLSDPERRTEVTRTLTDALAVAPDRARPHALMGEVMRQQGLLEEALDHLRTADSIESDGWTVGTLGQVLAAMGDPTAIEVLTRAVQLDGALPWIHVELADAYRLAGRFAEALRHIDNAIELNDRQPWAWAVRGAILSLLNRWDEAKKSLARSLGLFPDYAWALAVKAGVHVTIGEFAQAYADVVRSLELDDSFAWAWGLRAALVERRDGSIDEQRAAARRGVELDDTDLHLRVILADALARCGDLPEAERAYRRVIEMFDQIPGPVVDVDIRQAVAWTELRLGKPENALPHLGVAIARDAGRIDLGFDLGLVLMCLRRWSRAGTEYDTAVRRVRNEPHTGRRAALLGDALHNIGQVRAQGVLPDDTEVDRVIGLLRTEIAATGSRARAVHDVR